ncbi:hypothetical protein FLP10_06855 [Agromyces intestinalis]|uniref:Uncharacterized protein n=1 Tax=Agromyces intestinalis TaxID=2592652 RepID=A0A5C1YEQ2_9MICO|nr:hypothetical protein [Agromyces intestinalis]QEO14168.1 hypothetical protein FLP10_06855 [Agromyces intestinalis]
MTETSDPRAGLSRRGFVTAGAGLAAGVALWGAQPAPAHGATPTLPREKSRIGNQTTAVGKKPYDNIQVDINGDLARIFVPHSVTPSSTTTNVVWFYHAPNSSSEAMNAGFKWNAEYVVDQGWVAICQDAGGGQWTNSIAEKAQRDGWTYVKSVFKVRDNFLRATSGGGALACGVYATKAMPQVRGLYLCNGVYDLWKCYQQGGGPSIGPAFGNNEKLIQERNPARAPQSAWKGTNIRVVVSVEPKRDTLVPPEDHGLALVNKAGPVASEASVRTHTLGHTQPDWVSSDSIAAFKRWRS